MRAFYGPWPRGLGLIAPKLCVLSVTQLCVAFLLHKCVICVIYNGDAGAIRSLLVSCVSQMTHFFTKMFKISLKLYFLIKIILWMYSKPYAKIGNFINFQYFFTNTFFLLQEVKKAVCSLCTTAGAIRVNSVVRKFAVTNIVCTYSISFVFGWQYLCRPYLNKV